MFFIKNRRFINVIKFFSKIKINLQPRDRIGREMKRWDSGKGRRVGREGGMWMKDQPTGRW